jgi:hypothetical protein
MPYSLNYLAQEDVARGAGAGVTPLAESKGPTWERYAIYGVAGFVMPYGLNMVNNLFKHRKHHTKTSSGEALTYAGLGLVSALLLDLLGKK